MTSELAITVFKLSFPDFFFLLPRFYFFVTNTGPLSLPSVQRLSTEVELGEEWHMALTHSTC